jgi:hypothetical protein
MSRFLQEAPDGAAMMTSGIGERKRENNLLLLILREMLLPPILIRA